MIDLRSLVREAADLPHAITSLARGSAGRRVTARRWTRVGLTGTVGAAALTFTVLAAGATLSSDEGLEAMAEAPRAPLSSAELYDDWWGTCGTSPLALAAPEALAPLTLTIGLEPDAVHARGGEIAVPVSLAAEGSAHILAGGIDVVVLSEGSVVARVSVPADALPLSLTGDEAIETIVATALVGCSADGDLYGGDYEWLASQTYWPASGDPAAVTRVVSAPVPFTIDGPLPPVDAPAEDFYGEPAPPDGVITTTVALRLFDETAIDEPWDMAEGTSRWLFPTDGSTIVDGVYVPEPQFGCSYWGQPSAAFPATSSPYPLAEVRLGLPSTIRVRHGWIILDDPEFIGTVTNVSEWILPSLASPEAAVYLVRDGRVVAESFLEPADVSESARWDPSLETRYLDPYDYYALVRPGATIPDTLVWRDVSGCSADRYHTAVAPGTYTVLSLRTLSIPWSDAGAGFDWLNVQIWTSHGTVTVVNE